MRLNAVEEQSTNVGLGIERTEEKKDR